MKNLINRRGFLQGGLAGAAAATVSLARPSQGATFEGYPESLGVLVDLSRCVGCRSCEAACNQEQHLPAPEKPFNPDVCVGCRTCMIACPFYIPTFRYTSAFHPRIMKCVFCYDTRLAKGLPPACVEACPQEALTFGRRTDLLEVGRQRIRENAGAYVDHIYGEHEAGGTAWMYLSPAPFEQVGFDTSVPKEPILNFVKDFLSIVPMVLAIWPALFAGFHLLAKRKEKKEQQKTNEGEV